MTRKLPTHPNAPCRLGDRRFALTLTEVPTNADTLLGLASDDSTTWKRTKWAAYGINKADAIRRVERGS